MAAAIRAFGAIDMLLHFAGENLKTRVVGVLRGKITAEIEVFARLCRPEPKHLSQVGDHALRVRPRAIEGNRLPVFRLAYGISLFFAFDRLLFLRP